MLNIDFQTLDPPADTDPNRADVTCFVGFVARRETAVIPVALRRRLFEQGWVATFDGSKALTGAEFDLTNRPVPVESWEAFDALFAWDRRGESGGWTYLGAAVRSFFAQGGRTCVVVRAGDPWDPSARDKHGRAVNTRASRLARVGDLIPGFPGRLTASPADPSTWTGLGTLLGRPEVSMVVLPDLADALAVDRSHAETSVKSPEGRERFVTCSASESPAPTDRAAGGIPAPRCDAKGFRDWFNVLGAAVTLIEEHRRDVQLIAAVPIPEGSTEADSDLLRFLLDDGGKGQGPLASRRADEFGRVDAPASLASAFVQLAYPWVRSPGSWGLPEQLESPDGVLAGVLARNTLTRGAFVNSAGQHLGDVYDAAPYLARAQTVTPRSGFTLVDRVSLVGPTAAGLRLLSDVTTSLDDGYRPANLNRLVSLVARVAGRVGEESVFEPSGERLWRRIARRLEDLMNDLVDAGALAGGAVDAPFEVRCGRDTMTQNDLDSGRVVARVAFNAARPVDAITVVFAMGGGGRVGPPPVSVHTF